MCRVLSTRVSLFVLYLLATVCPLSFDHCLSFIFWPLFVLYLLATVCPLSFGHCLSFIFWPLFVLYLLATVCPLSLATVCPLSVGHCLSFIFWPLFVLYLLATVCPSHNGFWLHFVVSSNCLCLNVRALQFNYWALFIDVEFNFNIWAYKHVHVC